MTSVLRGGSCEHNESQLSETVGVTGQIPVGSDLGVGRTRRQRGTGEPQGSGLGGVGGELGLLGSGDHRTFRTETPLVLGKRNPGHLWGGVGGDSVRILKFSSSPGLCVLNPPCWTPLWLSLTHGPSRRLAEPESGVLSSGQGVQRSLACSRPDLPVLLSLSFPS